MTEQTIYTLLAACFGFISAVFFGFGSAFTSQTKMVTLSKTYWYYNKEYADSTVSQSTQYATGALIIEKLTFLGKQHPNPSIKQDA